MDDNHVAVILEDLRSQFRTFGDALQLINDKLDAHIEENRREFEHIHLEHQQNHLEHKQMMQMIKELDQEVQVELKRVK